MWATVYGKILISSKKLKDTPGTMWFNLLRITTNLISWGLIPYKKTIWLAVTKSKVAVKKIVHKEAQSSNTLIRICIKIKRSRIKELK